ncbi:endolytic transglycosylase MltG [Blastococcus sp. VKM Ac-2987]|uniref:endolytic transglycosylase MltG n=1 Tax=Blastococcus sp. VKM Ac-2987 TaxID=3004141 RepID=UPI0022ABA279|nr:endolytic transglycosylase MltG [Blastococcus sp. VKM Ac-2987]MCZ2856943.1 endolytic transglycosylase MltG [Blastococcus sp. VKM Ac-2987]
MDATGPLVGPDRWSAGSGDHPSHPLRSRHGGDEHGGGRQHPSAPLPPLPTGTWGRLHPRQEDGDDDATVAAPRLSSRPGDDLPDDDLPDDTRTPGGSSAWEETGGLDVIGANVDDDRPRRRGLLRRRGAAAPVPADESGHAPHDDVLDDGHELLGVSDDPVADGSLTDDDIPVAPYDARGDRRRRRRRPFAVAAALLVLGGLVAGIVLGGQQLLSLFNPAAQDYTGAGTGSVDVRVQEGDTLSDIARTLQEADVIASTGPFVDAAAANPDATSIQPGVYTVRQQMSGEAALELLLDPASRQVSRVTVPEGFTVEQVLARLAEETGTPIEELRAAADPNVLSLPEYANGQLEGFLFPATYDFEPDTTPQQMLQQMVDTFTATADRLQLTERAAALGLTPFEVVTVASMIQSETRLDEERPDVAQVIYNRLEQGIALGIDATLAYGLDKSGNELTVTDLASDNPYNTRNRQGLPPTPISVPGEASLEAALAPSSGELLYYVLESQEGAHFFTSDYGEFQAARQRCAAAGLGCGG